MNFLKKEARMKDRIKPLLNWFKKRNWTAWEFQQEAWKAALEGKQGLISVPTGSGKTYAAFLGPLTDIYHSPKVQGVKIIYLTPLRALTRDIELALRAPIEELNWELTVESRTGDTSTYTKIKQKKNAPDILLTTPESLSILISDSNHREFFKHVRYIIVDEWHELLSSKRGVLLELSLAHLRTFLPDLKTWALSATLGNLEEAAQVVVGRNVTPYIISARLDRPVIIHSILPSQKQHLPWAGFLGITMLPYVLKILENGKSTMIFTNTRSQAERWYGEIVAKRPEWKKQIALHHSSIDKEERQQAEDDLKSGKLKFIVCTSSLDLGVDFPMVEQVIQIASCKSIARLIQRAGRASHVPLSPCHIYLSPSHALELAETIALKRALDDQQVESRTPFIRSFDVLFQHLTTLAIGGGFTFDEGYKQIIATNAFMHTTIEEYEDILNHLVYGGKSLEAYPDYHKLLIEDNRYVVKDRMISARHKMNIGTITSDAMIQLKMITGKNVGTIEESFLSRLRPGEAFSFGGKVYKLVQMKDLAAYVRINHGPSVVIPAWYGSKLPISPSLAYYVRLTFDRFATNQQSEYEEEIYFEKICELQRYYSAVPHENQCLVERVKTREGWHHFFYPFEGKLVHEAMAAFIAHKLSKKMKATFQLAASDYGFEILCSKPLFLSKDDILELLTFEHFMEDLKESVNLKELARSRFRDIARIGGLVFSGYPTKRKTFRQLQVSSSVLFDVFDKFEPEHLLLKQAYQEVLADQIQIDRFVSIMERLISQEWLIVDCEKLTPFSLPLYVTAMWHQISSETLMDRILKITQDWS